VLPVWIMRSSLLMYCIRDTVLELRDMNTGYKRRAVPFYDF
jgi:hypothetical protein